MQIGGYILNFIAIWKYSLINALHTQALVNALVLIKTVMGIIVMVTDYAYLIIII